MAGGTKHMLGAWNIPLVQVSWFDRVVVELGAVQIQNLVSRPTLDTIFLSWSRDTPTFFRLTPEK